MTNRAATRSTSLVHNKKRKRARSLSGAAQGSSGSFLGLAPAEPAAVEIESDPDVVGRAPKRLRRSAVRSASLPIAAVAVRSRRSERLARRKRERALVHRASGGAGGMQVDS